MEALNKEAVKKNLIFLNEIGLDPGIDIMGTMKILHEAHEKGWKVVSYESYCGGLPVAEHATNPMGYKFSWNPGAAIKASRNVAIFKRDGKKITAPEPLKEVRYCDDISVAMKFEVYPNRDSFVFMDKFGMQECETFIRGTFRYKGFSAVSESILQISDYLCISRCWFDFR
jgi:saccharopine dehydrogenase-like NADP-dependent oxidoreductase